MPPGLSCGSCSGGGWTSSSLSPFTTSVMGAERVRVPSDSKIKRTYPCPLVLPVLISTSSSQNSYTITEIEIIPLLDAPPVGKLYKHAVICLPEMPEFIFKQVVVDSKEKDRAWTKNPAEKKTPIDLLVKMVVIDNTPHR